MIYFSVDKNDLTPGSYYWGIKENQMIIMIIKFWNRFILNLDGIYALTLLLNKNDIQKLSDSGKI